MKALSREIRDANKRRTQLLADKFDWAQLRELVAAPIVSSTNREIGELSVESVRFIRNRCAAAKDDEDSSVTSPRSAAERARALQAAVAAAAAPSNPLISKVRAAVAVAVS